MRAGSLVTLLTLALIAACGKKVEPKPAAEPGGETVAGKKCTPSSSFALRVRDYEVCEQSWRFAMMALYSSASTGQRARAMRVRETVMDELIERELLAQAAESAGAAISTTDVEARIAKGEMYVLGNQVPGQGLYFKDEVFDHAMLERYTKMLGLASIEQFVAEQQREMLAQKMRDTLLSSVRVSPDEVLERYQQDNTSVEVEYVKLKPLDYQRVVEVSDADLAAWLAKHEDEVTKKYALDKNLYTAAPGGKWIKLRQIVVRRGLPADDPDEGDETGKDQARPPDPARAKAEMALARLKAGQDFAAVAREVSEDERSARRGGLTDWRQTSKLDPKLAAAVETLGKGTPSAVIDTAAGYYVVRVEDTAEGDLGYDQVKLELAEGMARDYKAVATARADAEEALAKAKTGAPLATLFPRDEPDAPRPGRLQKSGPLLRDAVKVRGIGESKQLARAIFNEIAVGALGDQVYEVDAGDVVNHGFVIVHVTGRTEPDMDEFERQKDSLARNYAFQKHLALLDEWTSRRCLEAKADITVNATFLEYGDVDEKTGRPFESTYQPCTPAAGPMMGGGMMGGGGSEPIDFAE